MGFDGSFPPNPVASLSIQPPTRAAMAKPTIVYINTYLPGKSRIFILFPDKTGITLRKNPAGGPLSACLSPDAETRPPGLPLKPPQLAHLLKAAGRDYEHTRKPLGQEPPVYQDPARVDPCQGPAVPVLRLAHAYHHLYFPALQELGVPLPRLLVKRLALLRGVNPDVPYNAPTGLYRVSVIYELYPDRTGAKGRAGVK